ncbi:hypothetical protein RHA1_ro11244 (plasmid) [Rhodococcus jostii RHA1]|uniref:Uncharacterized protein n=1 Tax=Rhodococcus jostii (strain RHA1) TaxID=101510 RepID=Q0RUZ5_RHOJR|nr:hypothetical protein RHA1_ro11244 [Rhodococcus jostii RHA1]
MVAPERETTATPTRGMPGIGIDLGGFAGGSARSARRMSPEGCAEVANRNKRCGSYENGPRSTTRARDEQPRSQQLASPCFRTVMSVTGTHLPAQAHVPFKGHRGSRRWRRPRCASRTGL